MRDPGTEELLARLRRAEEAIVARDDFLAIAAHELRSPLNAVALRLAALERMAAQFGARELHHEIERTRRSVDRYVRRAVVLLDVSRLNSQSLHLTPEWVSLKDAVRTAVDAHREEAAFHRTTVEGDAETDARGFWDAHMVEEVLANLVSNAIKYGRGTPVRVEASVPEDGVAHFAVSDGGPGLTQAERARIFEKFERVVSTARNRAGFGLGLWIVGRMVAAHGGSIEVTAPAGGGSHFLVRLPLQQATAVSEDQPK